MADPVPTIKTSYDRQADTFYFTAASERPKRYVEDDEGLVWRYSPHGNAVGVTVQAYTRLWGARRLALAEKIAQPFKLAPAAVLKRLPS